MAIDKLKKELEANKNNRIIPAGPIVNYLIGVCKVNEELSEAVKSENKNLKDCFEHIQKEVMKLLKGKSGYVEDQKVYDMACSYYLDRKVNIVLNDIAAEITIDEKAEEKENLEKEIDKKLKIKDKKIEELEKRIESLKESNKQEALTETIKSNNEKATKKKGKKNANIEGQMSLF